MPEVKNIPRNKILGLIADALLGTQSAAAGQTLMTQGGPVDLGYVTDLILGKAGKVADDASYGFPPTKGSGYATQISPDVLDVAGLVPGPGTIGKAGKSAAKLIAESLVPGGSSLAALYPGGRKDLIATHATRISRLVDYGDTREGIKIRPELYSPSFAISPANTVSTHFLGRPGEYEAVFVPKSGAFDPQYDTTSLFNRDAYLPRWGGYKGSQRTIMSEEYAKRRLSDRFEGKHRPDLKFGEGFSPDSASHRAAILESPAFHSFREYERSPRGAKLLTSERNWSVQDYDDEFINKLLSVEPEPEAGEFYQTYDSLRKADPGNPLQKLAANAPSEYAELKAHGPVHISPERFAGVISTYPRFPDDGRQQRAFIQFLLNKDVPVASPVKGSYATSRDLFELARLLQEQVPAYGRRGL